MITEFAFVPCGPDGKHSSAVRSQVRSHCMRGRNKRDDSRRSVQQAKRAAKEALPTTHRPASLRQPPPVSDRSLSSTAARLTEEESESTLFLTNLAPAHDQAIVRFAESVDKTSQEVLQQSSWHVSNSPATLTPATVINFANVTTAIYPFELCIEFGMYQNNESLWSSFDEAFFHVTVLITSAAYDFSTGNPLARRTRSHLGKALSLLNEKLSKDDAYLVDSTLYTILCLAVLAGSVGDYAAADAHVAGLHRIVGLRGGLAFFQTHHMLQFKLESLDLMLCLAVGAKPRFLTGPIYWGPSVKHSSRIGGQPSLELSDQLFDARLISVFQDLQQLAGLINGTYERRTRLSVGDFQSTFSSIQTRLLYLKDTLGGSSECLCLGMLAILTTVVRIPGRRLSYSYLARRLQQSCRAIPASSSASRTLILWLTVVCGMTVFDSSEPWLLESWEMAAEPGLSWLAARQRLQKVIWIKCVHEESGKQVFTALGKQKQQWRCL